MPFWHKVELGVLIAAAAFAFYAYLKFLLHIEGITIRIPRRKKQEKAS